MENNYSIVVDSISRVFGVNTVIDDLSFKVLKGSVHGFLGPNGAGKTTTMKMIMDILPPSKGNISIHAESVGALLEIAPLFEDMIVEDYLVYVCKLQRVSPSKIKLFVEEAITKLNLKDVEKRLIRNLSKGYKQRVAVAQAIVFKPEIIILDEPTVGLDPASVIEMRNLISKIGKDHTVLISSHLLHEIEVLCDHITIIKNGKLVISDTVEQIKKHASAEVSLRIECLNEEEAFEASIKEAIELSSNLKRIEKENENNIVYRVFFDGAIKSRLQIYDLVKRSNLEVLEFSIEESNLEQSFLSLLGERE